MRKKLIELLYKAQDYGTKNTYEENSVTIESKSNEKIADHLIANGVTFGEDINVPSKWIPVSERLPEPMEWVLCACRAKIVEVLRYDHIMDDWDTTMPNRCYMKGFVTHWMPLPEPPKEGE